VVWQKGGELLLAMKESASRVLMHVCIAGTEREGQKERGRAEEDAPAYFYSD
jgi:hypothetical protein